MIECQGKWCFEHLILHLLHEWILHKATWELLIVWVLILRIRKHHHLHIWIRVHTTWDAHLSWHHHAWELSHLWHHLTHTKLILLHEVLLIKHLVILSTIILLYIGSQFVVTMSKRTIVSVSALAI